jgi:uncharacterized protein YceK
MIATSGHGTKISRLLAVVFPPLLAGCASAYSGPDGIRVVVRRNAIYPSLAWDARALLLCLALLALSGCGTIAAEPDEKPAVFQKGRIAPGTYLSSVIVRQNGCQPFGTACTKAGPLGAIIFLPRVQGTPEWLYEAFAHELCHAVAGVQGKHGKADPCHNEDGGAIHVNAAELTSFRPR